MQAFGHADPDSAEPADWNGALQNAWDDFTTWRRYNKISSSQKRFKFRMLFREEYGFFLNCKGFNARLISEWLLSVIVEIQPSPPPDLVPDDRFDLCVTALILGPNSFNIFPPMKNIIDLEPPVFFDWPRLQAYIFGCTPRSFPGQTRTAICRYFGLTERASRWLHLVCAIGHLVGCGWLFTINPSS